MALLRYQLFLAIGVAFMSIWLSLILNWNGNTKPQQNILLLYAPCWFIITLGIYAVGSIVIGLINFKDTPEAANEIDRQVLEARKEMKRRRIITDD
mgnify:CR=1 FL=1